MYKRYYENKIGQNLLPGKVLVLYGPRRVGKTTLVQEFLQDWQGKYFLGTGDDIKLSQVLGSQSVQTIISFFSDYELVVIDEAQKIEGVGLGLKILVDHIPEVKVIATGSSSFDLSNKVGEPLVGRMRQLVLYPVAVLELKDQFGGMKVAELLDDLLVYGSYPETLTVSNFMEKSDYLLSLVGSYLYRDILELEQIRNSKKILDLLRLVAYQIGSEVSLSELANQLDMSKLTVGRYLDLLEKSFVLINLRGFSRNLRKEVTKTSRYYFWDNGVRNAIINNFNPISVRNDQGQLWENFLFIERMKRQHYLKIRSNYYFWRTYDQKEIHLIEEREGKLFGFEFKWGDKKHRSVREWLQTYEDSSFEVINRDNYLEFIT